jgi:hypothetical protein
VTRLRFDDHDLAEIDAAVRTGVMPRCPHDQKPLLSTTWEGPLRMVYFVCRACNRIGAIGYDRAHPNGPGIAAIGSRRSSRPPPKPEGEG